MPNELLPIPAVGTRLPVLELREKGNYVGLIPRIVGAIIWLGIHLRIRAASRFHLEYYTVIAGDGVIYHPPGKAPGVSVRLHERLHAWQAVHFGRARYVWVWLRNRRHTEAAAYAIQVAAGYRILDDAARGLADPIYATGLGHGEAKILILEYVAAYREAGWTAELLREEAARG